LEARDQEPSIIHDVDLLITDGLVLTLNDQDERFEAGAVAIRGAEIAAVGSAEAITAHYRAGKTLSVPGCVIMPGLVNGHTHAAMTLFRGLADDLPLMDWLQNHIFPAEQRLNPDWVHWGTLLACAEMILSGTTAFCDMYLFEHIVAEAARQAGMRALVGEVLYDFPSPHYGAIATGLRFTEELIQQWRDDPLVRIAVEPHATYTCSPELLRQCRQMAESNQVPLIIHLSENDAEVEEILRRYGVRPVEHLERLGLLGPTLIADHCVVLDDDEIALLAARRVNVVHNPESNMKLANGVSPVPKLLDAGVNVALGTDGCASNNNLDMLGEMDCCAKLHKAATLDPTVLPAAQVLAMATTNGARALGWGDRLGVLAPGKLADCIVVDFSKPHLTPCYRPVSHLVYAARGGDVRHSVIHGRLVMEERRLLTLDVEEIMAQVRHIAESIRP
jgi:5-methylthioadenosine/S-adenosylhomocysteine deaminase